MWKPVVVAAAAPLLLIACTEGGAPGGGGDPRPVTVSDKVASLAAPGQDLSSVRVDPVDGCYVYRYNGPVETTFLPLRSRDGRPICTR